MIKKCVKCADYRVDAAKFQNDRYGYGMRVHNKTGKEPTAYRCTVCSNENRKAE